MVDFFNTVLSPLMWGEAWVMLAWHQLFTLVGIGFNIREIIIMQFLV